MLFFSLYIFCMGMFPHPQITTFLQLLILSAPVSGVWFLHCCLSCLSYFISFNSLTDREKWSLLRTLHCRSAVSCMECARSENTLHVEYYVMSWGVWGCQRILRRSYTVPCHKVYEEVREHLAYRILCNVMGCMRISENTLQELCCEEIREHLSGDMLCHAAEFMRSGNTFARARLCHAL